MHVFISYSTSDRQQAEKLASAIEGANLSVWWEGGEAWNANLDQAIQQAVAVVVLVTEAALQSHRVTYQWTFASALRIPVIPVLMANVALNAIHARLAAYQPAAFDADWVNLMNALKRIVTPLEKIRRLSPNDYDARRSAERELAAMLRLNPELVPTLIEGLSDHDHRVRAACAYALGECRVREALPHLVKVLAKDDLSRDEAVEALGKIGDTSIVPELVKTLYDVNDHIRLTGIEALGQLDAVEAAPEIIELLDDPVPEVRWHAAETLGRLGCAEAEEALIRLLSDNSKIYPHASETVSQYAAASLSRMDSLSARKAAREWTRQQQSNPNERT